MSFQGRPAGFFPGGHRRRKGSVVGGHHGECGARAYNGGMGAEPPAKSRGRAPNQGVRGAKPPLKLKAFLVIGCPTYVAGKFSPCICISTLGATVMIWEKFYVEIQGGHVTPLAPSCGRPCVFFSRFDSVQVCDGGGTELY